MPKKNEVNYQSVAGIISMLSELYYSRYVKKVFSSTVDDPRYDEREYVYKEQVYEVSGYVLGWYMGNIYYFDGRVWCTSQFMMDIVEKSIEKSLVRMKVRKGDIRRGLSVFVKEARKGAERNVLDFSPSLIGFTNGVWDFSDIDNPVGYSFEDRKAIRSVLPYDYNPSAGCPMWCSFLSSILVAGQVETLQKFLGLGCVRRSMMDHKIEESLWLVGGGANGKSTIGDVVTAVYGVDNIAEKGLGDLICSRTETRLMLLADIVGKIFCWGREVQAYDVSRYADRFKALCSGERQTVRVIGGNPVTVSDIPFMIFNMNQMPRNDMLDHAWMRRLVIIRFRAAVTARDMDRELPTKLMSELSGIRNWMMEGYRKLVEDNYMFTPTGYTDEEKERYMVENGKTVALFMEKKGIRSTYRVGHLDERPQIVTKYNLFDDYIAWCEKNMYEPDSENMFGRELTRLGFRRRRTSRGIVYEIFSDKQLDYALNV